MNDEKTWDWETLKKEIPVKQWQDRFNWAEEAVVSPDGEKIASIINLDEAQFTVCVNGKTWEETFEKAWSLQFLPDGRLGVLASNDEEWTVCIDGIFWNTWFDYIWDLKANRDGSFVGAAVQKDGQYGMAVNDTIWDNLYDNINGMVLCDSGKSGAIVQVTPLGQADIDGFSSGAFSVAVNGAALPDKFMNIWDLKFNEQGDKVVYAIRKNRVDYSVGTDAGPWEQNYQFTWRPHFIDNNTSVIAPVRQGGKWILVKDETPFWDTPFEQLWKLVTNRPSNKIGAVVSDAFGKWTVCDNGIPWQFHCDTMISDLFYSGDGECLTAVFKDKGYWDFAVDQVPWNIKADKLWRPVTDSNNEIIATRMEKDGKYYLVVNGKIYGQAFDQVFEPEISPDNDKILLKAIRDNIYSRQILTLDQIL